MWEAAVVWWPVEGLCMLWHGCASTPACSRMAANNQSLLAVVADASLGVPAGVRAMCMRSVAPARRGRHAPVCST
jgi:hypothetical protein